MLGLRVCQTVFTTKQGLSLILREPMLRTQPEIICVGECRGVGSANAVVSTTQACGHALSQRIKHGVLAHTRGRVVAILPLQSNLPSLPPPIGPSSPAQICAVGAYALITAVYQPVVLRVGLFRYGSHLECKEQAKLKKSGLVITDLRKAAV